MKKRVTAFLLASVMMVSAILAGCGSGDTSKEQDKEQDAEQDTETSDSDEEASEDGEVTEVTYWALNTKEQALEPMVQAFNEANPDIHVTISYYAGDALKDACKVAASSDTLPNMWFNWGGSLGSFYVENGLTYDLTEYAAEHGWDEIFTQSALSLCTMDGKLSGYPTSYNTIGIYYRKDIFEQYGLKEPETFEEFEEICATLKENGIAPIAAGGLNGWHVMRFVELLIEYYAGPELHDAMNTFNESYDNEAVVKALTKYQEFCEKGYFPEGFETTDANDTIIQLASGICAMDPQGQWYDGMLIQNGVDINDYGAFALPTGGSNRMSAFCEMTQFNANNTEKELDACVAFMDYYFSQENVDKYGEYYSLPLPRLDATMPEGQPNVEKLLTANETNGTFTITDQAFPTEVCDALFSVQDQIANGQITPEEGAKKIQEAIELYKSK